MVRVRIASVLPYLLRVPNGEYPIPPGGVFLRRTGRRVGDDILFQTEACSFIDVPDDLRREAAEPVADRQAGDLLARVNRLLRWYRLLAGRPEVRELTLAGMSPFMFTVGDGKTPWSIARREYERPELPPTGHVLVRDLGDELRNRLAKGTEPDPAELTLLDAEHAMMVARFRDAVLLCWSAIDSSVVQAFESLVDRRLAGEWSKSLEFLKGVDYGLRHKMTSGMKLLCGRSLFEDRALWEALSDSYTRRNNIIHRNQSADLADARKALQVARQVLSFLKEIQP